MRAEQVGRALADAASARVRQLVAELARQGKQRADTRLAAPYDGIITSSHAEPGHVVAAGQPIAQLARTGAPEAATSVPENALDALRSARSPATRLWSLAGKVSAGKLRELLAAADPATRIPELKRQAERLRRIVAAHPRVTAVNLDWFDTSLSIKATLEQDKLRALGLRSDSVGRLVAMALSGATVTQFRENDKLVDGVLRMPRNEHRDVDVLRALPIGTFNGKSVTLGQVAEITPPFEDGIIWRRDRLPTISVRGDPLGATQPATIVTKLAPQLEAFRRQLPQGFRVEIGGPVESSAKANAAIAASMPLILVTTFSLLMLQLGSFSRSLRVVLTAPLGLIGVLAIALFVSGQPMGLVALLGIISLAGMIMRNSVILVDQIQQDIRRGLSEWEAIIESSVRRMRPISLTAAGAVLAMIPLSGSIFWGPMAFAVMGGLIGATLLTLFFLPALYAAWFRVKALGGERRWVKF